jgi:hypothetical protein
MDKYDQIVKYLPRATAPFAAAAAAIVAPHHGKAALRHRRNKENLMLPKI